MKNEPRIEWEKLGWKGFVPGDGPIRVVVVAPWCPDCVEAGPGLSAQAPADRPVYLVGEFAPRAEVETFAKRFGIDWPILSGTSEKNEASLNAARFRDLRVAYHDDRRWGVPTWIDGTIQNGWFICEKLWF